MAKKKLTLKQQESLDWWNEKLKKYQSKKFIPKDYKKMNRRAIRAGSLVTFSYPNPKTPLKILRAFDAQPLAFIFRIGKNIHAINLHWTPRPMRKIILEYIIKINKHNVKNDKRFELSWEMLKQFLHRNGLADVITKQYIKGRIQKLEYIKPAEYKYIAELPSEKFILDGQFSEEDLQALIYRHIKKTKSVKNKRYGR